MATSQKPAGDKPTDEDVPALPDAGTLVRLDDPEAEGEPRYALSAGPGVGVFELPPVTRHELKTYKA
jgi:hypothetical protein